MDGQGLAVGEDLSSDVELRCRTAKASAGILETKRIDGGIPQIGASMAQFGLAKQSRVGQGFLVALQTASERMLVVGCLERE